MAEEFRTIAKLPPLRLTVADIAQVGNEIARQMRSGGSVDIRYDVDFSDDTHFSRDSSDGFLANLDADGERIDSVAVSVIAWTKPDSPSITKTVHVRFRSFGSELYLSSDDVNWGKGAVGTIKNRLQRHRPWFAPLLGLVPVISGVVASLPVWFIVAALAHERRVTATLIAVVVLSLLLLAAMAWFWREYFNNRLLAHTVIHRARTLRNWSSVKFLIATVAVAADVATLIALLIILLSQ